MGFDKSIYEQNARTADYAAFGKMLSCFDEIIENAVPIDIHGDKYRNTARADADLKNVFVLVSAYRDNGVVPIQLEVKEFIEKDNSLYVAVTLHKIKDAVFTKESASNEAPAMAAHIFIISLRDLFANINPADGEFLKYAPDGFLNDAQKAAKAVALDKESGKLDRIRFSLQDVDPTDTEGLMYDEDTGSAFVAATAVTLPPMRSSNSVPEKRTRL